MKSRIESKLDAKIIEEIYRAAVNLGADDSEIRAVPLPEMYGALEQLGADPHLLGLVGSWGDAMPDMWTEDDDAETLAMLRDWNAEAKSNPEGRPAATVH